MDLDSQFLVSETYQLVFMMDILYHLNNPFYVLEQLSKSAKYAIPSTRIMRWSGPAEQRITGWHSRGDRQLMEPICLAQPNVITIAPTTGYSPMLVLGESSIEYTAPIQSPRQGAVQRLAVIF